MKSNLTKLTRRDALKTAVVGGTTFWLAGHAPALIAKSPNEKLLIISYFGG